MVGGGFNKKIRMRADSSCDGIEIRASFSDSNLPRIDRNKVIFWCSVLKMLGEDSRIDKAWEEVVANMAGSEAEKTDAEELIRYTLR